MADTVAVISAITALCAVLLSPLVSMWTAQRQSRVTVLSANRQAWINSLRDLISEYISVAALLHAEDWSDRKSDFNERVERLSLVNARIQLMLNPKEEDHQRLVSLLGQLALTLGEQIASGQKKDSQKAGVVVRQVVPLAQSILKREWERVKNVE